MADGSDEPDRLTQHGGNLDAAMATFGGAREEWLDLSTGINPEPYPLPEIPPHALAALPTRAETARLAHAAAQAYGTVAPVLPLAGASQAIALAPLLLPPGKARLLGPTYGAHAAHLGALGWKVKEKGSLAKLEGADLAVVCNPNNPDGARHAPEALLKLARTVRLLVVDESFADTDPELSLAPHLGPETKGVVVQRSFGKFYGLAGLRLGFAIAGAEEAQRLAALAGPWPVSGIAIAVGRAALDDGAWAATAACGLSAAAARLDALAAQAGWRPVGGTALFRTYETGDAAAAQARLAGARIWSRRFDYAPGWLRLGPPPAAGWARLEAALGTS